MADEAHENRQRPDHDTSIEHPVAVARLLADRDFEEPIVAAALLHDVVEDTEATQEEIERQFGPEVATLVDEMTEKAGIEPYEKRKAEHRRRVAQDRRAAAIYAADKLASTRHYLEGEDAPSDQQLAHYLQTVRTLSDANPEVPFLGDLRAELERLSGVDPLA